MKAFSARVALAAAFAGLLVTGCGDGGSSGEGSTTVEQRAKLVRAGLAPPKGCYVTVFLGEDVTPAQTNRVRALLLANPRILEVSFVPKRLALERFAATNPAVAARMHVNLFPDKFEAVPATRGTVFSIITDFAAGVGGVANVKASRSCDQS